MVRPSGGAGKGRTRAHLFEVERLCEAVGESEDHRLSLLDDRLDAVAGAGRAQARAHDEFVLQVELMHQEPVDTAKPSSDLRQQCGTLGCKPVAWNVSSSYSLSSAARCCRKQTRAAAAAGQPRAAHAAQRKRDGPAAPLAAAASGLGCAAFGASRRRDGGGLLGPMMPRRHRRSTHHR